MEPSCIGPKISDHFCNRLTFWGEPSILRKTSNNQPGYTSYGELTQAEMTRSRTCSRAWSVRSASNVHRGLTTYMHLDFVQHVPLSGYLNIASIGNSEYVPRVHCFCPER